MIRDKRKKVLASVIMGLNCVNSFAPMALAAEVSTTSIERKHAEKIVAEPEQYTAACYQALDVIDRAVFGTAEAAFTSGVISGQTVSEEVVVMDPNDPYKTRAIQRVYSAGKAIDTSVGKDATQQIEHGGETLRTTVGTGGTQYIHGFGLADGTIIQNGGVQIVGGSVLYGMPGPNASANNTVIEVGGTQILTRENDVASNTIINGGTQRIGNAHEIFAAVGDGAGGTAIHTSIFNNGVQDVMTYDNLGDRNTVIDTTIDGGTANYYDAESIISGVTLKNGLINIQADGGSYAISGSFIATGGTVDMYHAIDGTVPTTPTYETLTIENLSGNGATFLMDTDLASETNGDKIVVNAATANAGGAIQVYDKSLVDGTNVEPTKKLLLVTDNSGVTSWTGKSLDTGGLWTITPTVQKDGNNWYLVLNDKTVDPSDPTGPSAPVTPNPTAESFIGFTEAGYGNWRAGLTDDTLRKRLGDLRYDEKDDSGVWARIKAGKLDAGSYDGSYQTYQVGIDKKSGNTAYGLAVDHSRGTTNYALGNGENSMTNLSLYATTYHKNGAYSDVVLKAGKYRGDINIASNNDSANYDSMAYSLSYELGKTFRKGTGWFIEPEAQLIYGRMQGADYTSNQGVDVKRDGINSFLGRVGFVAGRKINETSDYYIKANMWREFAGTGGIALSAVNNYGDREYMSQDGENKDTWFELGIGGNVKLAKKTHLYGDVLKTFGADISKKWQINAGVCWKF